MQSMRISLVSLELVSLERHTVRHGQHRHGQHGVSMIPCAMIGIAVKQGWCIQEQLIIANTTHDDGANKHTLLMNAHCRFTYVDLASCASMTTLTSYD